MSECESRLHPNCKPSFVNATSLLLIEQPLNNEKKHSESKAMFVFTLVNLNN